jgi:acetaldehyde dehydrogenase
MNGMILGAGKIAIDLYIKCKRVKNFKKIYIFNRNKLSMGGRFCRKKKFNYFDTGVKGLISKLNPKDTNIIFDATSARSSLLNEEILKPYLKNNYYINLTPSKIGDYAVPYHSSKKISQKINLITCGGQSSIPLIIELSKTIKKIVYVELVSSIASFSAGEATRDNINEYIKNTQTAISNLTKIKKNKVIINLNPTIPPVNMMNSIFFEVNRDLLNSDIDKIKKVIKTINSKIKIYIPGFNAKFFETDKKNIFRITIRVVGQGDYLPSYAGNLDIITSSAVYLAKLIYAKNYN